MEKRDTEEGEGGRVSKLPQSAGRETGLGSPGGREGGTASKEEGSERDRQTSPRITEFNLGRLLTVPFLLPPNLFRAAIALAVNFSNTFSRGIRVHRAFSVSYHSRATPPD